MSTTDGGPNQTHITTKPNQRPKANSQKTRAANIESVLVPGAGPHPRLTQTPKPPNPKRRVGNWQEDRDQAPIGDTANRVIITDPQFGGYSTSSSAIGGTIPEQRRAKGDIHKTMMSGVNFHEIHTGRDSSAPTTGLYNATLPSHPPTEFATYRETTYGKFFEADPTESRVNGAPPPEQGDDTRFRGGYPASCNPVRPEEPMYSRSRAFFNKGQIKKDFFDDSKRPDFRGSYGSRGANVRVPEESGSRAAVSVFVDEYSLGKYE